MSDTSEYLRQGIEAARIDGANIATIDAHTHAPALTTGTKWPVLDDAAYYGSAGNIVKITDPHTEADPVAILIQTLISVGSVIGRGAYFVAEADQHYTNEFAVLVGETSKGRKGSSFSQARYAVEMADDTFRRQIQSGLVSGEGLVFHVRDKFEKKNKKGTDEIVDEGVSDKRLLIFESEFAQTLRVLERDSNTLSPVIRNAWDRGDLQSMAKNSAMRATGAHVSIIAHTTIDEAKRYLSDTEASNGFANRFLWCCVKRSKVLPESEPVPRDLLVPVANDIRESIQLSKSMGKVSRDDDARKLWYAVYPALSEGKPGLAGALTARGEAHVMRLAMIYAILDQQPIIKADHLRAALAVWDFCEASVAYIFSDRLGDPIADKVADALKDALNGLTRTDINNLFNRNMTAARIDGALSVLSKSGMAHSTETTPDGLGRPTVRWFYG
jgi:hypothetical protein